MATVYLAIEEKFQREVALKIMSPALSEDENFSDRFLREAQIVSQLVHPNIVTVHDVGIENGHHFLSMEYIDGEELKQKLPSLNAEQLLRVMTDVAGALDYAGQKGYVHRDVKPENIMLHNLDGRAVLMDFGIARAADSEHSMTRTGTALGTPHYMSPEQARGKPIDGRSDLYSLGVLFYYMLMGEVPYQADSPVAIGIKHVTAPVPKLPVVLSSYQSLLDKLMAKKPEDRFQTGKELIEDLQQLQLEPLNIWLQRSDKPLDNSRTDTPIRQPTVEGDEVQEVVDLPLIDELEHEPESEPEQKPQLTPSNELDIDFLEPQETLHIPKEDLDERSVHHGGSWGRTLMLLVLLVIAGAGGYFYQTGTDPIARYFPEWRSYLADILPIEETVGVASSGEPSSQDSTVSETVSTLSESLTEQGADVSVSNEISSNGLAQTIDPIEELWQQIEQLQQEAEDDISELTVPMYRQIIELDDQQVRAHEALEQLQNEHLAKIKSLMDEGELNVAESLLSSALELFPELTEQDSYRALQQRAEVEKTVAGLLLTASERLAKNQLLRPSDASAYQAYSKVLNLQPENPAAKQGMQAIAARYLQLAQAKKNQGDLEGAVQFVANGLSVRSGDKDLLALQQQLKQQMEKENRIEQLLVEANQLEEQQQLFGEEENAAQKYSAVLVIDSNHIIATSGLQHLLSNAYTLIDGYMVAKDFEQAEQVLDKALFSFPQDEELLALMLELERSKPGIDKLLLSGEPIVSIEKSVVTTIKVDRTLHIAFKYKNMIAPTTVFQAVLYDGGKSLQIAAVPVVVVGSDGNTQFRIDRPVEGFTDGGYHIDLLLAGESLFSQDFVITH